MSAKGRLKGAVVREFFDWYRASYGAADVTRRFESMSDPGSLRDFNVERPGCGILAATWYAAEDVHRLLDTLHEGRSPADVDRIVREGAEEALKVTLNGLHRALMRVVGSPSLHARFAQRLWSAYYDNGRCVSVREGPRLQRVNYTEWRSHHPLLCAMTASSDRVIFPLMGLKDVKVKSTACIDRGDASCAHTIAWQ